MVGENTKSGILEVASQLFAEKGFEGTSIREIAKLADVNISAVNYHFGSKENLLYEVFLMDYHWLDTEIKKLHNGDKDNVVDFSWRLFCFFMDNGVKLHNTFKIFSSDKLKIPEGELFLKDEEMGPPGSEALLDVMTKELGEEISHEAKLWGARIIFGLIVHVAIVKTSSAICQQKINDSEEEFWKQKENEIKQFALSIRNHLKHYKSS